MVVAKRDSTTTTLRSFGVTRRYLGKQLTCNLIVSWNSNKSIVIMRILITCNISGAKIPPAFDTGLPNLWNPIGDGSRPRLLSLSLKVWHILDSILLQIQPYQRNGWTYQLNISYMHLLGRFMNNRSHKVNY